MGTLVWIFHTPWSPFEIPKEWVFFTTPFAYFLIQSLCYIQNEIYNYVTLTVHLPCWQKVATRFIKKNKIICDQRQHIVLLHYCALIFKFHIIKKFQIGFSKCKHVLKSTSCNISFKYLSKRFKKIVHIYFWWFIWV